MKHFEIEIGGLSKKQLLETLNNANVRINELGLTLLNSEYFITTEFRRKVFLTEIKLKELGFENGCNLSTLFEAAHIHGLKPCSEETAPYLRLSYIQSNSKGMERLHKSPPDSATVVSRIIDNDDDFPKGFYLRTVDNQLWLRGYICNNNHIFDPNDLFIFEKLNC